MAVLEKEFDSAMLSIHQRAKVELGYNATIFFRMLCNQGGLLTARQLINSPKPSEGYTRLFESNRLDLTVEAVVVENMKWHVLFSEEELRRAKKRLADYGYRPS